ncbi:MAG: 4-demethylwyosine synthase TYW1 [Crenarchaeota archaeon]|nr:4-demethylwyosine synthase TYW1 [Thermoproteota archaeon]
MSLKELMKIPMPEKYLKSLTHAGYKIIGKYGAYEPCHYFKTALRERIMCYKYWFFGIKTHRCIQWSPVVECNQACLFCWRVHRADLNLPPFKLENPELIDWDEPEVLVEQVIDEYFKLLKSLDPRHNPKIDKEMWEDAMRGPDHLATSLIGEPLMYPRIDDLMQIGKNKGMTTFIVTNGTMPHVLERMHTLPHQLYISVVGPDFKAWAAITRPLWDARSQWESLIKTLELLPSLNVRKVFRITAVRGYNLIHPEKYAKLVEMSEPDFVEVKGYSWVGRSKERLPKHSQPTMEDIREFAYYLSELTGYEIIDEVPRARVVLLWNERTPLELRPRDVKGAKR